MMVVVFTSNNARVFYTDNPEAYSGYKHIVNPDLSEVVGYPPHFWKLEGRKVVPMTPDEQSRRLAHHDENGVDNLVAVPPATIGPKSIAISRYARLKNAIVNFLRKLYEFFKSP